MASFGSLSSGQSFSLHASYQRYKAGTGVVIDWLVFNGPQLPQEEVRTTGTILTVRELLHLAKEVAKRPKMKPPVAIRNAFQMALVNRRYMTRTYQTMQKQIASIVDSTDRHVFFNEILAQAYDVLFPKQTEQTKRKGLRAVSPTPEAPKPSTNRFDVLSQFIEQEPDFDDWVSLPFQENHRDEAKSDTTTKKSAIEDDPMDDAIALHSYVLEMEALVAKASSFTKAVADGSMPLSLAGALMVFVFQHMRCLSQWCGSHFGHHKGLLKKYCPFRDSLSADQQDLDGISENTLGEHYFTKGYGLVWPVDELHSFKASVLNEDHEFIYAIERRKLHEYFMTPQKEQEAEKKWHEHLSDSTHASCTLDTSECKICMERQQAMMNKFEHERSAIRSILRSILQLADSKFFSATNSLLNKLQDSAEIHVLIQDAVSMPLLGEVGCFLGDPEGLLGTELVCGLVLFLESTKTFIWMNDRPNPTNCRLLALKLANEVRSSIELVRDIEKDTFQKSHRIDGHEAELLRNVSELLKRFTCTNCFDLYHQSPWVAGSNMSAILGNAPALGLIMLGRQGIFVRMLHMYNMLQKLGIIKDVQLLELLCNLFVKEVFLGSRPNQKFDTIQNRSLGGSLVWSGTRNGPSFLAPPKVCITHDGNREIKILEQRWDPLEVSPFVNINMKG
jgi:hypothetical protein